MDAIENDRLVPAKTLAKHLGISVSTLLREVKRGNIPPSMHVSERRRAWWLYRTLREIDGRPNPA